jgi:hypothetical protein
VGVQVEADSGEPKRLTHEQLRRHTEEGAHEDTDQDALTFVMSLGHLTAQDYSSEASAAHTDAMFEQAMNPV